MGKSVEKRAAQPAGRPSLASLRSAQRSLNEKQLQFVGWLATPEDYRKPASQAQLALELGVSGVTLWRWSKDPQVMQAVRWIILQNAGDPTNVSKMLDVIAEIAHDHEVPKALRLKAATDWLKAVGVHDTFKSENRLLKMEQVEDLDLSELSDEQLWELYQERAQSSLGELGYSDTSEGSSVDSGAIQGAIVEDGVDG